MAGYNRTRHVEQLLENTESLPPSFTVHLHPEYWVLNNGSKFLYNNQIASLLDDIRAHRIPVDFLELFDSARVPFYEGCMIVELLDYRPPKSNEPILKNPDRTRAVLHPSPETLWADICSLNQRYGGRWTDLDALELEAKLLLATSQPLCLDPDPHLARIVNNVLRASTPSMPLSLKRKASAMEPEEDGPERAKRERLLGFMAPRDNRLHAPSYRLLDAIEVNRQKKEAIKASGVIQHDNQYIPANSQSVQPVPQSSPPPQIPGPVNSHSPEHGDKTPQTIDTPQTFTFQANGTHTPVPPQPTPQFVSQHTGTLQPSLIQPQVYASLQAAKEATGIRAPTPAQQPTPNYQHYTQQYQFPQQIQHQSTTQVQPPLPRPPSQPQHTQSQPAAQPLLSPQPPNQQPSAPQQNLPQRFAQTPKPQVQPTTIQPTPSQPQPNVVAPTFHGTVPNPHFLQPASGIRSIPKAQQGQPSSIHPQLTLSTNSNSTSIPPAQIFYHPQGQAAHQQQGQQLGTQTPQPLYLQRVNQAAVATGGRKTPAQAQQSPRLPTQPLQPNRTIATTPSPVKGSPIINQAGIVTANQARASPMQPRAQIAIQQSGSGQQHAVPVLTQQSQSTQQQPAQQANPGVMQMPSQRYTFQPQYNHSRSLVHGNPQMAAAGTSGTPTMAHASPIVGGGRPLTPAVGGDVKPQQPQTGQGQQPPIRRPTPLQQQLPAISQMPAHALKQQQTPQIQAQQLPQAQSQVQNQQAQAAVSPPQVQQTPVQMAATIQNTQQVQHQQRATYAQIYGYPFWPVAPQQQTQPGQNQQNLPTAAAQRAQTQQAQLASMTPQQQQMYQLSVMIQHVSQHAQAQGHQLTPQQIHAVATQRLAVMAQAQAQNQAAQMQSGGQQQLQGGQPTSQQQQQQPTTLQQPQQQPQLTQAMMMGKLQMQVPPSMHAPQGHVQGGTSVGGQTTNITPAQMHHYQQLQYQAAVAQAQHGGQRGKAAGKGVVGKKGPAGR